MKKLTAVLTLTLVVVSFAFAGCSSDSEKKSDGSGVSDNVKTKKSSDSSNKTSTKTDPDAEAKFDEDVATIKAAVATSCEEVNGMYSRYKTAGNTSDGFDEIIDINFVFGRLSDDITYNTSLYDWPTYGEYENYHSETVAPFKEKMDDLSFSLSDVTNASIYDEQTPEQTEKIHTTIQEFEDYVNDSDFGPCVID